MIIETFQILEDGFYAYIQSFDNIRDVLLFVVVMSYVNIKYGDHDNQFPSLQNHREIDLVWSEIILFNFLIIILTVSKFHFFMKLNNRFGMLVQLVANCLIDVFPFSLFLLIWIIAFSLLNKILGSESHMLTKNQNLNSYFIQMIQVWLDSIGNISLPTYDFWV